MWPIGCWDTQTLMLNSLSLSLSQTHTHTHSKTVIGADRSDGAYSRSAQLEQKELWRLHHRSTRDRKKEIGESKMSKTYTSHSTHQFLPRLNQNWLLQQMCCLEFIFWWQCMFIWGDRSYQSSIWQKGSSSFQSPFW